MEMFSIGDTGPAFSMADVPASEFTFESPADRPLTSWEKDYKTVLDEADPYFARKETLPRRLRHHLEDFTDEYHEALASWEEKTGQKTTLPSGDRMSQFHESEFMNVRLGRKPGPRPGTQAYEPPEPSPLNFLDRMQGARDPLGSTAGGTEAQIQFGGASRQVATDPDGTEMLQRHQQPTSEELGVPEFGQAERDGLSALITDQMDRVPAYRDLGTGKMNAGGLAREMGLGVGKGGGLWITKATFGEWMGKQGKGLLLAPIMIPLTNWLNSVEDNLGDYVSLGLVAGDLLMTGDPFGLLVMGVAEIYTESARVRQRLIDNDIPDKAYGSRFGYIRRGNHWMPAFFNNKFESTGLFAYDNNVTMSYGSDIGWFMDGEGNWRPQFTDAHASEIDFVMQDDELNGKMEETGFVYPLVEHYYGYEEAPPMSQSSKQMVDMALFTRDWYFLSDEDQKAVQDGSYDFKAYEQDKSSWNNTKLELDDWRNALTIGKEWKWAPEVHKLGTDAHVPHYDGARGLDRVVRENITFVPGGIGNFGGELNQARQEGYTYQMYKEENQRGEGRVGNYDSYKVGFDYIKNTALMDHVHALYKAQAVAAGESGFRALYEKPDEFYDYEAAEAMAQEYKDKGWGNVAVLSPPEQTAWSSMYLDTQKDLPIARSSSALAEQLDRIELYTDRTPAQRNYLAQKAQVRYWMGQVSSLGETDWMLENLVSESGYNGWLSGSQGRAWIREGGTSKLDQPGWVKPWQNANDQVLPDFTGLNENSMEDIMHDGDDLQEFSDGAAQNAAKRIKETGGWDPNILIATGEKVDMESSGRTIFDTLPAGPERTISWQLDPDDPTLPQEPPDETDPVAALTLEELEAADDEDKPPAEDMTWEEMMAKAKRDSENTGFVDPGEEERKRQEEYRKWMLSLQDDTDDDTVVVDDDDPDTVVVDDDPDTVVDDDPDTVVDDDPDTVVVDDDPDTVVDDDPDIVVDQWDEDVPDPYANSHGPDGVPSNMHGFSVLQGESIDHEEQTYHPMTPAFHQALQALEQGPRAVKVI